MYYDRLGRSLDRTPSRPVPASAAPATPLATPLATSSTTPTAHASSAQLKDYLATHRTVWHTDSLRAIYPEIVGYLQSRYVASRQAGRVTVRAVDGSYPDVSFDHDDLRHISETLLSREYRQALFTEQISPAIERLSA